jgi:hypothetical protein
MFKLVDSFESAKAAIIKFNDELKREPALADRLGLAHAFYVTQDSTGKPIFAFSKFVGYDGLTASSYLKNYGSLTGIDTEHVLKKWFEELTLGTAAYNEYHGKLQSWLASFGKKPRGGKTHTVRIMVPRPGCSTKVAKGEDRRIVELLIAVAEMLSTEQRLQLRAAL